MKTKMAPVRILASLVLLIPAFTLVHAPAANAAAVIATGTDAAICNQEVSDSTNVTAVRLAGGDCVITFKSGTIEWTPPSNVKGLRILLVGGGGGGGGSYDTAGAGGGGAGQVISIESQRINPKISYTIKVAAGGGAGFHVARTNSIDAVGLAGGSSNFGDNKSINLTALGGGGGSSSRASAPGASSRSGGAAATPSSGAVGGGPGGGGFSGGGGGGSLGAGAVGNSTDPERDSSSAGGTGTSLDISGSSVVYGTGGAGGYQNNSSVVAGTAGTANTGNGGGGASVGASAFANQQR